ncbi:hypothetical protein MLD38_002086 [Melastoma candidum]|uniref:Uncharacterized protein n=1 Tax=Melastoma candidum TaxID=119954 RepID=A0ACB9SFR6_9MYRT|nr:hypothetical protein MLD38_002086 [Melastoma candidum]
MEPPPAPPQQPLPPPPPSTGKPTAISQKDRDFLLHLEAYLAKRDGVDKLLKISRYTAKLLLSTAAAPSPRLKSFESSVGLSRKAFRLGKFVQDVNALRFFHPPDRQSLILSLIAYLGEGTYFFVEQFVWLSKSGLIDKRNLSYLQKVSAWTELIGYAGSLGLKIRDLTELREEEGRLTRSLEVGLTRGDACREEAARLRKVREKALMKRLSIVQDIADAIMALSDVSDGQGRLAARPSVIASAGLISALISAHKNWVSC